MKYIDALRGFAMLSVVIGHVWLHMDVKYNPFFQVFNVYTQLPLFFFISGFLYRKEGPYLLWIKTKFIYLVIPALIFLFLFCIAENIDYVVGLSHDFKLGYWFTLSLFQFFVIFSLIECLACKLHADRPIMVIVQLIVSVILYYLVTRGWMCGRTVDLLSINLVKYYFFFVVGVIANYYKVYFYKILDKQIVKLLIGGGYLIILAIALNPSGRLSSIVSGASFFLITSFFSVLFFIQYFKQSSIEETKIGKTLILFGKRSLDIYFIHYFFLPENLSYIGDFYLAFPSGFFEYIVALCIALILIAVSLAVGSCIRSVPLLSKWMLGVKMR